MPEDDPSVVSSFQPGPARCVLVLAFDDLEDMLRVQERVTSQLSGWTDEGERYDRVETLLMSDYAAFGKRPMAGGALDGALIVAANDARGRTEQARRQWSSKDKIASGLDLEKIRLADSFSPGPEQADFFDKWVKEVVDMHPAGGERSPSVKLTFVREAFNVFVKDHKRPDLQFTGTAGGRAFSALLRARFRDEVQMPRGGSAGNLVYLRGLQRKPGGNPAWFPNLPWQAGA